MPPGAGRELVWGGVIRGSKLRSLSSRRCYVLRGEIPLVGVRVARIVVSSSAERSPAAGVSRAVCDEVPRGSVAMKGLHLAQALVATSAIVLSSPGCRAPGDKRGGPPLPALRSAEFTVGITVDCPYGLAG